MPSPTAGPLIPATASYYLRSGSLSTGSPTAAAPSTVTLTAGGAATAFDLPVQGGTALSGAPVVDLFVDVRKDKGAGDGQGFLVLTVLDCSAAAGPCASLATTTTQVNGVQEVTATLPVVTSLVQPGHVLRLTVSLDSQGNAGTAIVSFDAASAPSRLDLTAAPPP